MRRKISSLVAVLLFFFTGDLSAQQKRIYIANDDHTDYMWAADEATYRQAFLEMLDYYLNLTDQSAGNPSEFRSRFSADGAFWAWVYEKNRSGTEFERLIQRIKDGSITLPLTLLNLCYGAMPAEAVLRSMSYAGKLERRYGLRLELALSQENQTLPYGVGTLWAGAGAAYFWKGICGCASLIPDAWDRPLDMYWWTGLDGSRLLVKWNSMIRRNYYDMGGYAEARELPGVIDFVDSDAGFRARHPYNVVGIFGRGGDDLKTMTDLFPTVARQASSPTRKVIVSNQVDFFKDFQNAYGSDLPSQSVAFGNEWDHLSASMSELSGRVKRSVEKLRTAEALSTLVGLRDASFLRGRDNERENAWVNLGMYYDHDWTADGPVSRDARAAWQRRQAEGIESYVDLLQDEALPALGRQIRKEGMNPRYFVFNSLGWARSEAADLPYAGTSSVRVIDVSTGQETLSQRVTIQGQPALRIWAENIPSLGYKVFEIAPGTAAGAPGGPLAEGDILENTHIRLRLGTNGAILSLIDKLRGGRERVREIEGRRLNDLGPGSGTIEVENAGPVSATLRVRSSGPLLHETTVTLYRDSGRIDIRNEILQNFGDIRTWSFGFDLDHPDVRHEEIGAVIRARLAEQGGHYSSRCARYDWLSLNHFVDISDGSAGVTISSPDLSFLKLGNSTTSVLDVTTPQISILAGGQVDGPSLGIPNQGGDGYFLQRFSLQTHDAFSPAAAMRFSLEHQNPLVAAEVTGGTDYPASSYSLLGIDAPDIFIWAVKPAEETSAGGVVVRLWNQTPEPGSFSLEFNGFEVLAAVRISLIETPIEEIPFQGNLVPGTIPAFGWRAYHLKLDGEAIGGKGIKRKKIR